MSSHNAIRSTRHTPVNRAKVGMITTDNGGIDEALFNTSGTFSHGYL